MPKKSAAAYRSAAFCIAQVTAVAQNMRRNICDLRVGRDPRKRLRHALDRLAGKLDHELLHGIQSTPSTEMDEEFELEYES